MVFLLLVGWLFLQVQIGRPGPTAIGITRADFAGAEHAAVHTPDSEALKQQWDISIWFIALAKEQLASVTDYRFHSIWLIG